MTRLFPFLILAGVIAEIASIIWVGKAVGVIPTLFLLFAGGAIGIRLLKSAGTSVLEGFRSPAQGTSPMAGTAFSRIAAGLLFLIPGFFSDILAVLVLLPPIQHWVRSRFHVRTFTAGTTDRNQPFRREHFDTIIEGEAVEIVAEVKGPTSPGSSAR